MLVTIEDDGPGVPEGEWGRVFEPFYRLDRDADQNTTGFGLGLAIAQKALVLHGGSISIGMSALGGARLALHIPAD